MVSYQTAYLKAHYPEEFMAGLMTLEMDSTEKTYKNIAECREMGIRILPPDVNESCQDFTVIQQPDDKGKRPIRFGLGAVRGVGGKAIDSIIEARRDGHFESLADFCKRVQTQVVNKRVVESLIKCGAFDFSAVPRRRLLEGSDAICQWAAASNAKPVDVNQMGLFAPGAVGESRKVPVLPDTPEWDSKERLRQEKEAIGFFITGHPLDKYERDLKRFVDVTTANLRNREDQSKVRIGGVIHSLKTKNTKKGDRYATFSLEDREGVVEVIAWPETYRKFEAVLHADEPVVIEATLEVSDERCQLFADEVLPLLEAREKSVKQVHFALHAERVDPEQIRQLRVMLAQHRGSCSAFLHLLLPNSTETIIALASELRVSPTDRLIEDVERLLGNGVTTFL
jgi:DNA polymerase-3 subunit alpha